MLCVTLSLPTRKLLIKTGTMDRRKRDFPINNGGPFVPAVTQDTLAKIEQLTGVRILRALPVNLSASG